MIKPSTGMTTYSINYAESGFVLTTEHDYPDKQTKYNIFATKEELLEWLNLYI